jgi:hypothetical protein
MKRRRTSVVVPAARKPAPMRPSFEDRPPLPLAEMPPTEAEQVSLVNDSNAYLRRYRLGECSVIVTREFGKWHLSISHRKRYPTWDEIAEARYRLLPDEVVVAMILPPKGHYINLNPHCFQMHEIDDPAGDFAPPPS